MTNDFLIWFTFRSVWCVVFAMSSTPILSFYLSLSGEIIDCHLCNLEVVVCFFFVCIFGLMRLHVRLKAPKLTNDFDSRIMCLLCHLMWNFQFSYRRYFIGIEKYDETLFRNISTYSMHSWISFDCFLFR